MKNHIMKRKGCVKVVQITCKCLDELRMKIACLQLAYIANNEVRELKNRKERVSGTCGNCAATLHGSKILEWYGKSGKKKY